MSDRFRGLWVTGAASSGLPIHRLTVSAQYLELERPLRDPLRVWAKPTQVVELRTWVLPRRHFFFLVEEGQLIFPGAFVTMRPRALRRALETAGWTVASGGHRFRRDAPLNELPA